MEQGNINLENIFTTQNIIIYFVVVNFLSILMFFIDKKKAEKNLWRISEKALILVSILGGSVGALIGMYTFRHKTKKLKFTVGIPVILILQIVLIIYLNTIGK